MLKILHRTKSVPLQFLRFPLINLTCLNHWHIFALSINRVKLSKANKLYRSEKKTLLIKFIRLAKRRQLFFSISSLTLFIKHTLAQTPPYTTFAHTRTHYSPSNSIYLYTHTYANRHTHKHSVTHTHTHTQTDTDTQIQTQTHRYRHRHTDRQTHTHTQTLQINSGLPSLALLFQYMY